MNTITRTQCPDDKRLDFLPTYVGSLSVTYESLVYGYMDSLAEDYHGGYWEFYTLSNDGFYMALNTEKTFRMIQPSNYFNDTMSADAASIAINLYALNTLTFEFHGRDCSKKLIDAYHALRDFALEHEEANKILGLID